MHNLGAEPMICAFVFQIVGAGDSVLMSNFLAGVSGAIMPILHIETAAETHILFGPLLKRV